MHNECTRLSCLSNLRVISATVQVVNLIVTGCSKREFWFLQAI